MTKLEEQAKRDRLVTEGKVLDEKIEYYNSLDSKRNIAVSTYKLSEPGEQLYKIEDADPNVQIIEEENLDPINLEDNKFWWRAVLGL